MIKYLIQQIYIFVFLAGSYYQQVWPMPMHMCRKENMGTPQNYMFVLSGGWYVHTKLATIVECWTIMQLSSKP